ncbi:MAG: hypothetical protein ACRDZ9_07265 [Acidimicrobiales bacterium]
MGKLIGHGRWGEIGDDLVGTASARLLALGVERRTRLDALRLLGLLADHADADRRVRYPLGALASEFHLSLVDVDRSLAALLAAEVVCRDGPDLIVAAREPRTDGLRLAGFLDNVAVVLGDKPVDVRPARAPLPTPGAQPGGRQPAWSRARAAAVVAPALAAVVAVLAFVLAPGPRPTEVSTAASRRVTAPTVATTTGDEHTSSRRGTSTTTGEPGAAPDLGAAPSPPSGTPDSEEAARSEPACPTGAPQLQVTSVEVHPEDESGETVLDLSRLGPWVVEVRGELTNPATARATVEPFVVTVDIGEAPLSGAPERKMVVAADATTEWTVVVPIPDTSLVEYLSQLIPPHSAPSLPPVLDQLEPEQSEATLGGWGWTDPDLARSCPTS